jgi:hypothetical protein
MDRGRYHFSIITDEEHPVSTTNGGGDVSFVKDACSDWIACLKFVDKSLPCTFL